MSEWDDSLNFQQNLEIIPGFIDFNFFRYFLDRLEPGGWGGGGLLSIQLSKQIKCEKVA